MTRCKPFSFAAVFGNQVSSLFNPRRSTTTLFW